MSFLNVATNGTYRGIVKVDMHLSEIEKVVNSLQPGQNCVIRRDRSGVYNSYMTPLFSAGEIMIAWTEGKKIIRDYNP